MKRWLERAFDIHGHELPLVLSFFGWFVVMWCFMWPTHGLGDVVMLVLVTLFMLGFLAGFVITWCEDHDPRRRS